MQSNALKLIVGLGNPGPQYRFNRHNAGAWLVTRLASDGHTELRSESKFFGDAGRITIAGQDVRLLFPTTFMNRSGQSVAAFCSYFDIAPENMLVAYDEIDFDVIVVGSGAAGGVSASELVANGLRVCVIEAGRRPSDPRQA